MNQVINIEENCQFLKDLNTENNFMGTSLGLYNLAVSNRDLSLFCKGIKPSKNWRLKDVKKYFGLIDLHKKEDIKRALNIIDKAIKGDN